MERFLHRRAQVGLKVRSRVGSSWLLMLIPHESNAPRQMQRSLRGRRRSIFFTPSLVTLVIAGIIAVCGGIKSAKGQMVLDPGESDFLQLGLEGNRSSRQDMNRPLADVLDEISRQFDFQYRASESLLKYPVCGSIEGISTLDGLKRILKPFNHLLLVGSTGEPRLLFVIGLKGASAVTTAIDSPSRPPDEGFAPTESLEVPVNVNSEHLLFNVFDNHTFLPEELEEYTSPPSFASDATGPGISAANTQELPEFEPIINAAGPDIPGFNTVEFPEFEPYYSEQGPRIPKF